MKYTTERIAELAATAHIFLDRERAVRPSDSLEEMHAVASVLEDGCDLPDPFLGALSLDGMREDRVGASLSRDEVLSLSPENDGTCVCVPRAVEG